MATIKAFTDVQQSKKLAEILPLESADMYYWYSGRRYYFESMDDGDYVEDNDIPAWSLSALLDVLPNNEHITTTFSRGGWKIDPVEYIDKWFCEYENEDNTTNNFSVSADNPVDACYELILNLHEQKLL